MAHQGPVKTAQAGLAAYMAAVGQSGAKWAAGIQATQANPMQLASAQVTKAMQNYSMRLNDAGPGGWVAKLQATPVAYWKLQCGQVAQQKYQMGKGGGKWSNWYQAKGQTMATGMRNSANTDRANGVPWQQRLMNALNIAVQSKVM